LSQAGRLSCTESHRTSTSSEESMCIEHVGRKVKEVAGKRRV
jgi:hypothetical protein